MGPITVGAVLAGRYRVTARLGAGGMATIYAATDESLARDVAIKVLHPHLADDDSLQARFRAEARAAAGLLHPHIVNVFDQGVADLPYIVMEYVDGPSLRELLTQRGLVSAGEALSIVDPVCTALARAHAAGVIHRDIKPENILIASDGTVKVADFGIARAVAETSFTATGTLIGSVHYLAPELMTGAEATPRSDQYAVGVVLFELLTGRKPLPAESPMAVAMRHAREKLPSIRDFVSDAPPKLDAVIRRATAIDPDKRFDDLAAMVAALRAAVPSGPEQVVVENATGDNETLIIPVDAEPTITVTTSKRRRRRPPRRRAGIATGGAPRRRLPAILATLLVVLAVGALALWNWVLAPVVAAPALENLSAEQAEAAAEDAGLIFQVSDEQHDVEVPAGQVLTQDPVAQESIRRGGVISVVVSLGPDSVALPNLEGKPVDRAIDQLRNGPALAEVKTTRAFSDTVAKGRVIEQRPAPGKTVLQGSEVTLQVSKGIEQVTVPAVVGLTSDDAQAQLTGAKLEVTVKERFSDKVPEAGTVIAQSVEADTTVDKGTGVTLTVSKGPVTITLGDYVGDGLEQTREALAAEGMEVRVYEQARPQIGPFRRGEFGRVEAQVPEPGTRLKRGETVTLYTFSARAEAEEDD